MFSLKEIWNEKNVGNIQNVASFQKRAEFLFRYIVPEDLTANQEVVELKTAENNETKPPATFFLPGFEGTAFTFKKLAEKLHFETECFQFPPNRIHETVRELTEDVRKVCFERGKLRFLFQNLFFRNSNRFQHPQNHSRLWRIPSEAWWLWS